MADDKVITEFGAEFSGFNAELDKAAKGIDNLDKSMEDASKSGKDLSGTMGDASKKAEVLGKESKKAAAEVASIGKSAKGSGGFFGSIGAKASEAFGRVGKSAKELGGKITGSLKGAATSAASSLGGFASSALAALGPVGIAVGALGAGLLKVFTNTDAGATYFDGVKRSGSAAFDIVTGKVMGFIDTLSSGESTIGKVFGVLYDAVMFVTTPIRGLVSLIGDITGITAVFEEANKQGQQLAAMWDDIDAAQTDNIKNNAVLEKQVAALNIKLRDRTLTDKERIKIGDEIAAKEQERAANELKVLKMVTAAYKQEAQNQLEAKGEIDDATRKSLAEAEAAEIKAAQTSEEITDRAQVRINQIKATGAARDEGLRQKNLAAQEKANAAELKLAQDLANAKNKANEAAQQAAEDLAKSRMTEGERAEFEITTNADKVVKQTREAFAELKRIAEEQGQDVTEISAQAAQAELDIIAKRDAEIIALRQKAAEEESKALAEKQDALTEALQTDAENQRDIINNRFNVLADYAEQTITNEEELTETLARLEQERFTKLEGVRDEQQIAAEEALKARQDAQIAIIQGSGQELATVLEGFASGQITTAEEAGKALVGIALDTVGAIVQAQIVEIIARSASFGAKAGPVGAAAGIAGGIAIGAIIKGLLSAMKSQIMGKYKGEEYVSGKRTWSGRDGHWRRLDDGERIVTTKANLKHWDVLNAIHHDKFDEWKDANMNPIALNFVKMSNLPNTAEMVKLNFAPKVNAYMETEKGRRMATEITLPGFFDKNIVRASREAAREQKETNRILRQLATPQKQAVPSKRLW